MYGGLLVTQRAVFCPKYVGLHWRTRYAGEWTHLLLGHAYILVGRIGHNHPLHYLHLHLHLNMPPQTFNTTIIIKMYL
jgi:hypothetical protein